MARRRLYATDAERHRAYRQRLKERLTGFQQPSALAKSPKKIPRHRRIEAVTRELQVLIDEYQAWLDAMPTNLRESNLADRLQETIDQLQGALDAVEMVEPPRGFGR